MLTHALLDDVSDVLQRRRKLLQLVVAESDVIGYITLVSRAIECFLELCLGILVLLLLVQDAALGNDSFGRIGRHR